MDIKRVTSDLIFLLLVIIIIYKFFHSFAFSRCQGTEFTGRRKADIRERQRLVQLVQLQAQEIDALKDEITLLSRKGGHILPPAQPPLPPGQTPIPNQ